MERLEKLEALREDYISQKMKRINLMDWLGDPYSKDYYGSTILKYGKPLTSTGFTGDHLVDFLDHLIEEGYKLYRTINEDIIIIYHRNYNGNLVQSSAVMRERKTAVQPEDVWEICKDNLQFIKDFIEKSTEVVSKNAIEDFDTAVAVSIKQQPKHILTYHADRVIVVYQDKALSFSSLVYIDNKIILPENISIDITDGYSSQDTLRGIREVRRNPNLVIKITANNMKYCSDFIVSESAVKQSLGYIPENYGSIPKDII